MANNEELSIRQRVEELSILHTTRVLTLRSLRIPPPPQRSRSTRRPAC